MNLPLTLAIPCRADEPGLAETLESLRAACHHLHEPVELMICLNGVRRTHSCRPLEAVRAFCRRYGIPLQEMWDPGQEGETAPLQRGTSSSLLPPGETGMREERESQGEEAAEKAPLQRCTVLLTEQLGKPHAWNRLWRCATGELVLFCDADVRVAADAVSHLLDRLQREPQLRLVAAREVPILPADATVWSRMGAIPYRFDFGNAGGRLYAIRKTAFAGDMPVDLLLEDAWLTVAVGRRWVAKEWRAHVYFLPPATWRDYFAERVRTEGGKLQIRRAHAALLANGPIAQYRWDHLWRGIRIREYPLVLLALGVRLLARVVAWRALLRRDFYALYRPFPSTKEWLAAER
ncbi:MAG: glycosyltransferase [Candidatus Binatia bacterium]|nr:glycosyltransferase [Candidatus Binatia bacterium]